MSEPQESLPIVVLEQIDATCQEFESHWKNGRRPIIADFVQGSCGRERSTLISELVLLEIEYRQSLGDKPELADYEANFPELDAAILSRAQFDTQTMRLESAETSTLPNAIAIQDELDPGTIVGNYVIANVLGRGGMGVVYAAEHQHLKRTVALKLQCASRGNDRLHLKRFRHEVEVIAKLSHPNIVTAFDAGEFGHQLYLVTELIEGADLACEIRQNGPMAFSEALGCIRQAAAGLAYAHQEGVIHRDVKPSNLLRDRDGKIKVSDLGLAQFHQEKTCEANQETTRLDAAVTLGTIDFMSPEQARDSSNADARSDIYSLGCTLYFLVTGRPIFEGATALDRVISHAISEMPDLRCDCPDAGERGTTILRRMTAKHRQDRFASMGALIDAIDEFQDPETRARGSWKTRIRLTKPIVACLAVAMMIGTVMALRPWTTQHASSQPYGLLSPTATTKHSTPEAQTPTEPPSLAVVPFDNAGELQATWANYLELPQRINDQGLEFTLIPPGRFVMGSSDQQIEYLRKLGAYTDRKGQREAPPAEMQIPSAYYLGVCEVTVKQFDRFVSETSYETKIEQDRKQSLSQRPRCIGYGLVDGDWRRDAAFDWRNLGDLEITDDLPVMNVSHHDAVAYVEWLSEVDGKQRFRLPYQHEWEFAARGGTESLWYFGNDPQPATEHSWHKFNSQDRPQPVGQLKQNPFGLRDIYGNVEEWCGDRYREGSNATDRWNDETLPPASNYNQVVIRGGHFKNLLKNRSASRTYTARETVSARGFRVLREIDSGNL